MRGDRLDLLRFPLADERGGVGRGAARQDFPDDVSPRGLDEFLELVEVLLGDAAGQVRQEQPCGDDGFHHGLLCSISQREYS